MNTLSLAVLFVKHLQAGPRPSTASMETIPVLR